MTSPICHFLHAVDALKELQQRRCQMKRTEKIPHIDGRGEKQVNVDIRNNCEGLHLSLVGCHNTGDFGRERSSAHLEGNGIGPDGCQYVLDICI